MVSEQSGPEWLKFGPADDDVLPTPVAERILVLLCERESVLFTVLLAEAMTGVRLAKVRHRTQPGDRPADQAAE